MNVGAIVQRILHAAPPPAPPQSDRPLPTPEDIRWAQAEKAALLRRAQMLNVDVDLERAGR